MNCFKQLNIRLFLLITTLSIVAIPGSYAQTWYDMEYGIKDYMPLTEFISIVDEDNLFNLNGVEKEFELPFSLPYFSDTISNLSLDLATGTMLLGGSDDFNNFLFGSSCELWTFFTDTINSDVRYQYGIEGEVEFLKIEFSKLALFGEIANEEPIYHTINYTISLKKNGIIGFQFGELTNIEESEFWEEENGIKIFDGFYQGPFLWMESIDFEYASGIIGTFDNPMLTEDVDGFDAVYGYPPEGWYCEFIPVDIVDVKEVNSIPFEYNSIAQNELFIQFEKNISKGTLDLISLNGKLLLSKTISEQGNVTVDLGGLIPGQYFFQVRSEDHFGTGRFIKL